MSEYTRGEGELVARDAGSNLPAVPITKEFDFVVTLPKAKSVIDLYFRRRSVEAETRYFGAVEQAMNQFHAVQIASNRIKGENLRAALDADTDRIFAHLARTKRERAEQEGRLKSDQAVRARDLAEAELATFEAQEKLARLKEQHAGKKDFTAALAQKHEQERAKRQMERESFIKDRKEKLELIRTLEEDCSREIARYKEQVSARGRALDLSEGSRDFIAIQRIEDIFDVLIQELP